MQVLPLSLSAFEAKVNGRLKKAGVLPIEIQSLSSTAMTIACASPNDAFHIWQGDWRKLAGIPNVINPRAVAGWVISPETSCFAKSPRDTLNDWGISFAYEKGDGSWSAWLPFTGEPNCIPARNWLADAFRLVAGEEVMLSNSLVKTIAAFVTALHYNGEPQGDYVIVKP